MKKLMVIGLIGAVALFAIAKKTSVFSYASTIAASVESDVKGQIPTKFELDRIRNEIAGLDSDVGQMIKPIAEYKAVIEKMRRDIVKTQENIDEQKKNMLPIVEQLQTKSKEITVGYKTYPAERAAQLTRDLDRLKQLEKHVKTQSQVLTAKEASLKATQEQLAKVISKKREYELRLSQLEAEEETLQIARIGSSGIQLDNNRASVIENALANVEHRHEVEKNEMELKTGNLAVPLTTERHDVPLDLQSLRNYLEGNEETSKTVSNK